MHIRPLVVSKVNTAGQILLAGAVLGILGLGYRGEPLIAIGSLCVGALTIASGAFYVRDGLRHLAGGGERPDGA